MVNMQIIRAKYAYIENPDPIFLERLTSYSGYLKPVKDISEVEDDTFFKFTICDLINPTANSFPHFKDFQDSFQVKVSGSKWMDITHPKADKGNAIKLLQKKLNIKKEESVAFGDYLNDIEMLNAVKYSYAMENAHPEIKKNAKYQTYSNNDFGVAKAISTILKNQ